MGFNKFYGYLAFIHLKISCAARCYAVSALLFLLRYAEFGNICHFQTKNSNKDKILHGIFFCTNFVFTALLTLQILIIFQVRHDTSQLPQQPVVMIYQSGPCANFQRLDSDRLWSSVQRSSVIESLDLPLMVSVLIFIRKVH